MNRRMLATAGTLLLLQLICAPIEADADPVAAFIAAADSVHVASDTAALARWLSSAPDLTGAAVAQLLDVAAQLSEGGDTAAEAGNLALVAALAQAHAQVDPGSAMPALLAAYRRWDAADRQARAAARAREDEAWAMVASGPDLALAGLSGADSVFASIGDAPSRARVLGRIGAAHWYRGDAARVEEFYTEALRRRRAVQDRMLEAATLNGLGSLHFRMLGDLAGAADWYRQAADLRRAIGDGAGLGTSLTYAANVQVEMGNLVQARALYEEARPWLGSDVAVVENLAGTAGLHDTMGRTADAIRLYDSALELCIRTPDCPHAPTLLVELAHHQHRIGQVREARLSLDRAEDLLATTADPEVAARLWQIRALISIELGDQTAARDQLIRSLELARESGNPSLQCDGSILISGLYLDLGAAGRARDAAEQALALARELADENLERGALVALAAVALQTGESARATETYTQALAIDERFGAAARIAEDLIGRGAAHSRAGALDAARADLSRAATLLEQSGLAGARWLALLNMADSFEESSPDSAAFYYDEALASLERGNNALGGEAFNTGYLFADRGRAYEEIARYYARRHRDDPGAGWDARAFATAERSRARGLLELLEHSFALDAGPEALALIDSLYEVDASTAQGRAARERIRSRLADLRTGRGAIGREPASLGELRSQLDASTLLLQYAVGDSTTLLWIVARDGAQLFELPPRGELRRRVTAFRDAIAQPGVADAALLHEARELYTMLLGPAAGRIGAGVQLVLVPDDVLAELPFEALLAGEAAAGADWATQPFLGRDHSPVRAPSSTVWLELLQRGAADYDRELVALGDADYSLLEPVLDPLPATRDEVAAIGAALDAHERVLFLGAEATEAAFRQALDQGSSRIIHLATHGLIDPAEPARSCIALGASGADDGYLYSLEILSLRLQGPMVVLSACESAMGRLERGEGVVGLTRSFLAAGARGVVASLWPVSDASTAVLMRDFYDELWAGRRAPEALRRARAELLASEDWSHPYFWSAFVIVGSERMPW